MPVSLTPPTAPTVVTTGASTGAPVPTCGDDPQAARRVLRQFRLVFNAVRSHFYSVEQSAGMGGASVWALALVAQSPGLSIGQLAQAMDVHQSTASNLLKPMLASGWLTRTQSTLDKRVWALHPAPEGLALLAQCPTPHSGVLPHALQQLSTSDLQALDRLLAQVLRHVGPHDTTAAHTPLALQRTADPI